MGRWSIGCVVGELVQGCPLLDGKTDIDQIQKMIQCLGPPPSHLYDTSYYMDRPHQQQQQLLEPDPLAMLLVTSQQELHGSPFHLAMPHHVDQVDQQRHEGDQESPRECLVGKLHCLSHASQLRLARKELLVSLISAESAGEVMGEYRC